MGERSERRLWRMQRGERMAAVEKIKESASPQIFSGTKDIQRRNQVNLDYIEYFKNINNLVVIKENKSGSLQLKIQK
jgi:hypothetical protein